MYCINLPAIESYLKAPPYIELIVWGLLYLVTPSMARQIAVEVALSRKKASLRLKGHVRFSLTLAYILIDDSSFHPQNWRGKILGKMEARKVL